MLGYIPVCINSVEWMLKITQKKNNQHPIKNVLKSLLWRRNSCCLLKMDLLSFFHNPTEKAKTKNKTKKHETAFLYINLVNDLIVVNACLLKGFRCPFWIVSKKLSLLLFWQPPSLPRKIKKTMSLPKKL